MKMKDRKKAEGIYMKMYEEVLETEEQRNNTENKDYADDRKDTTANR